MTAPVPANTRAPSPEHTLNVDGRNGELRNGLIQDIDLLFLKSPRRPAEFPA